jgi:hypothetical protein
MCQDHSPEDDAVLLVAVIAKTGSLQSFIEAARKLLEDCSSEHIDEVADLLPPELASPTFPTGALILEFCRQKLNLFKGR